MCKKTRGSRPNATDRRNRPRLPPQLAALGGLDHTARRVAMLNMKRLKVFFLIVDIGFVVYWLAAVLQLFPHDYLFKDYDNPILGAWNYSFVPLDLMVSLTGLGSIVCYARAHAAWLPSALVSLTLTFCSGLQAVAFWALRGDFDVTWWAPNLFLMVYPLFFLVPVLRAPHGALAAPRIAPSLSPGTAAR
jgi:hypothetical protein